MAKRDYYEILGVPRNSSKDDLKKAFRGLARKYHPDVSNETDAEERFKEINEAYAVLSDDEKRAAYDQFGHAGVKGMGAAPDFGDFSDIFEQFFGFGRSRTSQHSRNAPQRGADLQTSIQIDFAEAVFGIEKELSITRDETCEVCNGSGAKPGTSPVRCSTCNGSGEVRQSRQTFLGSMVQVTTCPACRGRGETISSPCHACNGQGLQRKTRDKVVSIPAGVDSGTRIRVVGEGQPGENGGPHGHLYVDIHVKPHKFFRRHADDILLDMNINIAQAALGSEIKVPTVDGDTYLKIPAGTQPGKIFRMRGKGVPYLRGSGRGDQLVIIGVEIPTRLTAEQRELILKLAESLGTEVKPQERGFLDMIKDVLGG